MNILVSLDGTPYIRQNLAKPCLLPQNRNILPRRWVKWALVQRRFLVLGCTVSFSRGPHIVEPSGKVEIFM